MDDKRIRIQSRISEALKTQTEYWAAEKKLGLHEVIEHGASILHYLGAIGADSSLKVTTEENGEFDGPHIATPSTEILNARLSTLHRPAFIALIDQDCERLQVPRTEIVRRSLRLINFHYRLNDRYATYHCKDDSFRFIDA